MLNRVKNLCVSLIRKVYFWILKRTFINARSVFYFRVLLEHHGRDSTFKIKEMNDSAMYVCDSLVKGEFKANRYDGYDEEIVSFGEKIYTDIMNNEEIRRSLIEYLKIRMYFCDRIRYADDMKMLDNRLNQLGVSERIDTLATYLELGGNLNKKRKALQKKIKAKSKKIVSDRTWELLGTPNFSQKVLVNIIMIVPSVYLIGSVLYIHFLLRHFGLDPSGFVTIPDYFTLILSKVYEMAVPLMLVYAVMLEDIYVRFNHYAAAIEYGMAQSKSRSIFESKIFVIIIIGIFVYVHFPLIDYFTSGIDDHELNEIILIDGFFLISFLMRWLPFERVSNGLSLNIFVISCWIFIAGLMLEVPDTVKDIKSPQTSTWKYLIGDEILTSDEYSLILRSSKSIIFYHRESESTRIFPVDDVERVVIHAPKN